MSWPSLAVIKNAILVSIVASLLLHTYFNKCAYFNKESELSSLRVRYFEGSSDKGISAPYLFSIWVGIDTYHGYADVHVKSGKTNVNRRH